MYGPQDQGAYNEFYQVRGRVRVRGRIRVRVSNPNSNPNPNPNQDRFEVRTQPLFNWKPYWGYHAKASVIHFHGPKPSEYLTYQVRVRVRDRVRVRVRVRVS